MKATVTFKKLTSGEIITRELSCKIENKKVVIDIDNKEGDDLQIMNIKLCRNKQQQ
jgi:hypothetical protein